MRPLAFLAALATALALILGGMAPFGRILLALGLPSLAAPAFDEPNWRGVALYRAGDMDGAAEAFRQAGARFNLGNALAHGGAYAAALEAYDLAMITGDEDAKANYDLVAAFYAGTVIAPEALALFAEREDGPTAEGPIARGNARAAGTGDEVTNNNTMMGLAKVESREQRRVRRVFDDKFMIANDRWLAQLSDVPGEYLAARIAHEHKRRVRLGLSPPEAEDPQ